MKLDKKDYLLYAVTERSCLKGMSLVQAVESACKGGVTMVQIREKEAGEADFLKEALEIKAVTDRYTVPLIINDNVEVAMKAGAAGVHVGQSDMEAGEVRRRIGRDMLLGVSAHSIEEAQRAVDAGVDYLGVGAVFATSTKLDANAVSVDSLREICENVGVPVVAIGGINAQNAPLLKGSGIAGLAVVSAIFGAGDIGLAVAELLEAAKGVVI